MVKENSTGTKKKQKSSTTIKMETNKNVYEKVCESEGNEANGCSSEDSNKLYTNTCKDIFGLLEKVHEMKQAGDCNRNEILTEIVIKTCLLKKLNRLDKLSHVNVKDQLNNEKQKCDSMQLTYQNLVYELHHLSTEIDKCLSFKSDDENIELVSFEDFLRDAPESVTEPFKNYDESNPEQEHALKLARLEWELAQRKNLTDEYHALEEKRDQIVIDISNRKEKLDSIRGLLNDVLKATKPLEEHFGVPCEVLRKEHEMAVLLPDTLYILYTNLEAYRTVFDTSILVNILGEKDDATQFNEAQEISESLMLNEEDSESESDLPEVEEVVEVRKRHHRKSVQSIDPLEEKKKKLLEVHPLTIELTLSVTDGPLLKVKFNYYTKLKIITVNSIVDIPATITASTAHDILSGENILSDLIENDNGLQSPNPCTTYQLQKLSLGSFQTLISNIGYAYEWAQKVCGINFLTPKNFCNKLSQNNVQDILKILKSRLNVRTHLAKQLQQLEQNIFVPLPDYIELPSDTITSLNKWQSSSYQNFCQAKFTKHILDEEIVLPSDLYYFAKISRGDAFMEVYVVIKNTYPTVPPIYALSLNFNGCHTSMDSDEIRDLERTLNVDWNYGEKSSTWLLSAQLKSLCSYLDVYLESLDSKVFQSNAKYLKGISGRNRKRPFRFRKIGTGIFTQY